jgi:hypothetical protein
VDVVRKLATRLRHLSDICHPYWMGSAHILRGNVFLGVFFVVKYTHLMADYQNFE